MATLTDLISDVRDQLDESSARQWTDAQITKYLNQGARDVATRAEVLQTKVSIATVAGTQEYAVPVDFIRGHHVDWTVGAAQAVYPLEIRTVNAMDAQWWGSQTTAQGIPQFAAFFGYPTKIICYPTPAQTGAIVLRYYRLPDDMASGADIADLPQGWTDLLVDYSLHKAWIRDNDPRWNEAKARYEDALNHLIGLRDWHDQPGHITVSGY